MQIFLFSPPNFITFAVNRKDETFLETMHVSYNYHIVLRYLAIDVTYGFYVYASLEILRAKLNILLWTGRLDWQMDRCAYKQSKY